MKQAPVHANEKLSQASLEKALASNKYIGMFPLEFACKTDSEVMAEDGEMEATVPSTIHLIPVGQWDHDMYGPITINTTDMMEFAQNFNAKIRNGVFITAGHEGMMELPAVGWITKVEAREDGLWGDVEWNELGTEALCDKQYKFFSPEFYRDYEDPQTHQIYRNVLTGGALTKSPYFKELTPLVASDKICFSDKSINQFSNTDTMNLNELLAKDITTLTDEEKVFIKSHAAELTDEQKASHTAIIEEVAEGETDEERVAREAKEAENVAAGLNPDGSAKAVVDPVVEPVADPVIQASEKGNVQITASELALLRANADKGVQAFAELEKRDVADSVKALMFSEGNKEGRFLPKSTDTLRAFMESLNKAQREKFSALVKELPSSKTIFAEVGAQSATEGTAHAEIESKVKAKMSEKAGMKYSDALKAVMSENPALSARYNEEVSA